MKIIIKRIIAYAIDMILVLLVSTFIFSNEKINKDYNKLILKQEQYTSFYQEYEIKMNEFQEQLDEGKIKQLEYDTKVKQYNSKLNNYKYETSKLQIVPTLIIILCTLMYFTVIQFYCSGKTLGKMLLKIQIVSNNGKELTIKNYFIRSLIIHEILINLFNVIIIMLLSKKYYLNYSQLTYSISYFFEILIVLSVIYNKQHRGLHDIISNTKVKEIKVVNNEM